LSIIKIEMGLDSVSNHESHNKDGITIKTTPRKINALYLLFTVWVLWLI
jgi:hypothetical protein